VSEPKEIASHPYEKCGTVNGQSVKVLIDKGSHYSLIKTLIAEKCRLPITEINTSLYGIGDVNNPSVTTSGRIVSTIVLDEVEVGPVQLLMHEIEDSAAVVCRPYKTTVTDREAIAEIVRDWRNME